jgi:O-antigen/teichoic acid export membrane protein
MVKNFAKHLFRGSIIVFAFTIVSALVGYGLRIYLARNLSIIDYGLFYAIMSFIGFFSVFKDLGLGQAMTKFIAEYVGSGDKEKIKPIFLSALAIQAVVAIAIMGIVIIFSDAIAIIYFKSADASLPLKLIAFSGIVGTFMGTLQQAAQGMNKIKTYSVVEPLRTILTFSIVIVAISFGIVGVSYAFVVAGIVTVFYLVAALRNTYIFRGIAAINRAFTKKMMLFALPIFIGSLSSLLLLYTDTIIITIFRGVEDVALYQVAVPTSQLLWMLVNSLVVVLLPTISMMWASGQKQQVSNSLSIITKFSFVVVIPFAMIIVAFAEDIIRILFGNSYLAATLTLQILAISSIFYTTFAIFSISLIAIGKPFTNTKIVATISVANLILNLIFIPHYGIAAAALSTMLAYFIGTIIAFFSVRKSVEVNTSFVSMGKIFSGGILSLAIIFIAKTILHMDVYVEIAISLILMLGFYTIFILKTRGLTKDELQFLIKLNVPIPRAILRVASKLVS